MPDDKMMRDGFAMLGFIGTRMIWALRWHAAAILRSPVGEHSNAVNTIKAHARAASASHEWFLEKHGEKDTDDDE